jgi:hypothetical protein
MDRLNEQLALAKSDKIAFEARARTDREMVEQKLRAEAAQQLEALKRAMEQQAATSLAEVQKQAQQEREARTRLNAELEQAKTAKDAAEKSVKVQCDAVEKRVRQEADAAVARKIAEKEQENAQRLATELARARELLKAESDKEKLAIAAESHRKEEAILAKLKEAERKLEAKTSNALGDGQEIDLYEEFRKEFEERGDKVTRVPHGLPGADIIHEVLYKGQTCGKVVIDSKNRLQWRNDYASKLHQDRLDEKADYAILAIGSNAFPGEDKHAGRHVCIHGDVIVATPAQVIHIARILRETLVRMQKMALSEKQRAQKTTELYQYINSQVYQAKAQEAANLAKSLGDIDVDEKKDHDKVWKKRGTTVRRLQTVLSEVESEVGDIIAGT